MDRLLSLLVLLALLRNTISEYCIQDKDEGCRFECHCADDNDCGGGTCPGGCDKAALGYNWGGPGCQIGNVGLNKEANMTVSREEQNTKYPPTAALDGQMVLGSFNNLCAHPSNNGTSPAEWWTDLGDIYKIYNVTIYGRTDCCQWRLQSFNLTIYNTSDDEMLCAYHKNIIRTHDTITCNEPVIGRYVHFKRVGGRDIHVTALCEVVLIGHKVYDCSKCSSGVICDDVIGCRECVASYQPECKPECRLGSYGINCNERCGNCTTDTTCDKVNGHCRDGCQMWWTDDKCKTYIDKPAFANESTQAFSRTSNSAKVQWERLHSLSANLSKFYGYVVVYKENNKTNYTEVVSITQNSSNNFFVFDIKNLNYNTIYDIQVRPYRVMNGKKDFGSFYQIIQVKTTCIAPMIPSIWNVTATITDANHIPNLTIHYQNIVELIPNCDEITNVSLHYKMATINQPSQVDLNLSNNKYTIKPKEEGKYKIWITVTNNEGYSSDSEKYAINIKKGGLVESKSSRSIIIPATVSLIVIVAVTASIIVFILWKRRKGSTSEQQRVKKRFINESFRKEPGERNSLGSVELNDDACNETAQQTVEPTVSSSDDDITSPNEIELRRVKPVVPEECLYANSAVNIAHFEGYLTNRKRKIKGLYKEYELLPQTDLRRCQVAITDENKEKNRFRNIYAYDDTRVLLEVVDNNNGDYINASYITGYNKPKEYIATQGPRRNTLVDFWRMVWQENSNCIVMVANVSEMGKKKVEPYWCETVGKSRALGDFIVKAEELESSADYDTRIMTLKKENQQRTVHHFHFKTWEDKSKLKYGPHTLLAFMDRVHSFDKHSKAPLIVHCSAGVGRTGTFIALDILQQMAVKDKTVDINTCVDRLRRERMLMVQTKEQYLFLHDVVVEFIKYMDTSHHCNGFIEHFASVCDQEPDPEIKSLLEKEFKKLSNLRHPINNCDKSGLNEDNIKKNRNLEIVPDDSERLFINGRNGNYINAVSVDSFAAHNSVIVTQMPLPHSVGDFWKLVMEENCRAIVMLNQLDGSDPTCIQYWPEEINSKKTFDQTEVELLTVDTESTSDYLIKRDLRVTEIKRKTLIPPQVMSIRHFQLTSWPNGQQLPTQRKHLLRLMEQLQRWEQHQKKEVSGKWKILVHCIDGGSHSGMFCGASFLLDRMKVEQNVNAFLAVRSVSRFRPQFFTKKAEYQFLYQMAIEKLTESNEYVNFR